MKKLKRSPQNRILRVARGGRKSQGAPKAGKPHSRQRAPHQTLMDSGGPDFLEKSGPPESIRV